MDIVHCMSPKTLSFHDVYSRYAKDVLRFSFWLCGNPDEAKDITSETFTRVWTSDVEIRVETVKAYLFTIARNLYLHDIRRKKKFVALDERIPDTAGGPEEFAESRLVLDDVRKALQTLPEIDRTVLLMRAENDLSYEEISRSTGLSLSAVKVKLFRARVKIHSVMTKQQGERL